MNDKRNQLIVRVKFSPKELKYCARGDYKLVSETSWNIEIVEKPEKALEELLRLLDKDIKDHYMHLFLSKGPINE